MPSGAVTRRGVLGLATAAIAGCVRASNAREHEGGVTTTLAAETRAPRGYDVAVSHDLEAWPGFDPDWASPSTSPEVGVSVEVLVERLEVPWDLAFAPGGDRFLTERTGRVHHLREGHRLRDGESTAWRPRDAIDARSVPPGSRDRTWWVPGGEGGTTGVAVHPRYPAVPLVYVYYTAEGTAGLVNRVASFDVSADDPARSATVIVDGVPAGRYHDGGRIAFGPANYLWVTTGDAGHGPDARDPGSLAGKVLRLTPAGAPAPGNPDLGSGSDPRVYTLGHRNPQGIAWLPDATPVITEHGPGPDEVSLLSPGADYGWPDVRSPREYVAVDSAGAAGSGDVYPPVASSAGGDTWAPSGCVFYVGDDVPAWRNRLLVGCLVSQRVKVVTLTAPGGNPPPIGETGVRYDADWLDDRFTATAHDALVEGLGRIRHVAAGPNGELYALTSNRDGRARGPFPTSRDDVLVRLRPG